MLYHVLIVTDNAADAEALQDVLPKAQDGPFDIEWVHGAREAVDRLDTDGIDIVLMDFFLPDSKGIQTFDLLFKTAPTLPILTIVSPGHVELASEAVRRGAQGYLLKDYFLNALVPQALRNVIQRKQVEDALFVEKEQATVTLNSIGDAVISTDPSARITYMNVAAERMIGWSRDEAAGHPVDEVLRLIDGNTCELGNRPIAHAIQENKPLALSASSVLVRRDGREVAIEDSMSPIYDRRGRITGAVMVLRNIGPTQSSMAQKMTYLAQHDTLTGLPNRILLKDRLASAITLARRNGTSLGVLFLDLDNFKNINDSLGHAMGDELLKSAAHRLLACVRASDTVSRHGGDEFVILVAEDKRVENVSHLAEKVLASLALPHHIQKHDFHTTASIGISIYPADGQDAETLLKHSDIAMYHVKKKGRNNYEFFNAEMNQRAVERHTIEVGLHRALNDQEFVLHYQPKVNLKTGMITGVEALVRWQHPERGLIWPEEFVSVAEDCGLIVPIGRWVLREACRQSRIWMDAGMEPISMSVNVSALEFRNQDFLQGIRRILDDTGLDPCFLELELTESVLMSNSQSSRETLHALKNMGVGLAIDDFGTGYSSLSYFQDFPTDVLKIDQSFVRGITGTLGKRIIVTAVVGMGISLMHRVIAEGIETREQFAFLNALECEEGQGYYFSPPIDAARCTSLLGTGISKHLLTAALP
ncbi:MAG TPA: EAL domain-containing protein [Paucimonas sp.]|nr:EAL domain-containing protein [Paucimonas sp.]HJW57318.1 EAL domain-containing protein [Burkholderiaceae bacterium]